MTAHTEDIAEARRMGYAHGWISGSTIDRDAVRHTFPRWTEAEVDAYLESRNEGSDAGEAGTEAARG